MALDFCELTPDKEFVTLAVQAMHECAITCTVT
jgi:hypothetical protein